MFYSITERGYGERVNKIKKFSDLTTPLPSKIGLRGSSYISINKFTRTFFFNVVIIF
jgi:hypothetical protein